MATRIWAQSASDLTVRTGFAASITAHAKRVCSPDTEVTAHGFVPGTYTTELRADLCCSWPLTHQMLALQVVENAMRAEREGYDAVVIASFMDHGVELARSAVGIPVVGLGSNSLFIALTMGRALGLVSPFETQARFVRNMVRHLGLEKRVVGVLAFDQDMPVEEINAERNTAQVVQRFTERVAPLLDAGSDLIIACEGFLASALQNAGVREVQGAPVFDALGALLASAEMQVRLKRANSFQVSRRADWARAPEAALEHTRAMTIEALRLRGERLS